MAVRAKAMKARIKSGAQKVAQHPVSQGMARGAKNVKEVVSPRPKRVAAGAGLMGGLALRAKGGATEAKQQLDNASRKTLGIVFASFAVILWIIDLVNIPGLGGVYSGLNFNPEDFWANWFSKFTFGNVWFDIGLTLIVIYIVVRYLGGEKPTGADIGSVSLFIITMLFFAANPGWVAYPKAIFHFLFIILFGFIYVRQTNNLNAALITIVGLLLFDFFLFSTLFVFVEIFKYISFLGTIIIFWTFAQSVSGFTAILFTILVIFIIVVTYAAEGFSSRGILIEESDEERAPLSELFDRIGEGIGNYQRQVASTLEARINYAITGQVEENQYEPLGVYLENVQSADARYYEDEDVIVWGTVKARTLDEPINIKIGCYANNDEEKKADKWDPEEEFQVFALEELDFACTFNRCKLEKDPECESATLKKGPNTITTFADFNFETLAYLKMYFINNERKRAMIREELDIFKEFDIKDKNPVPVYTNGPVAIEMGTSSPLVGVSDEEGTIVNPRFTISIENRPGWQGKITGLNELVLLVPNGVEIKSVEVEDEKDIPDDEKTAGDCNRKFKVYDVSDCKNSCNNLGQKEGGEEKECDKQDEQYEQCEKCKEQCQLLLGGTPPAYKGYNMTEIDKFQDDETQRFKRFNCKITPDTSVLGNTPITTKYIRVKAKYNYKVEEPITVRVDECSTEVC